MALLCRELRQASLPLWDEMQAHPFVRDIEADRLPGSVFARYLIYEHAFVETAILIFGHALLKAPSMSARRRICHILDALAGEQLDYFDRVFSELRLQPAGPDTELPGAVTMFRNDMLAMAEQGTYHSIVAMMLAAEWTYATWCTRAHRNPSSNKSIEEWVRLHAEPPFLAQVDWLKAELDTALPFANPGMHEALAEAFARTLSLEIGFHAAPYKDLPI